MMNSKKYAEYWDDIAKDIDKHTAREVFLSRGIVGPLDPYSLYKKGRVLSEFRNFNVKGMKVLEVGCGTGYNCLLPEKKGAEVFGVDVSGKMIELARNRIDSRTSFMEMDGRSLKFPDGSFDLVFFVTVLQHVLEEGNTGLMAGEASRVLKKGGTLVLFEDVSNQRRENKEHMVVERTVEDYMRMFEENSLELVSSKVLSSPFYRHPHNLLKRVNRLIGGGFSIKPVDYMTNMHPLLEVYLNLSTKITSYTDRFWSDGVGIAEMVFRK